MRKICTGYLLLVAVLCCTGLQSPAQSISTSIDKKEILIGEPIHYRLLFTFPSNDFRVEFNVPDSFPHFEMMAKNKFDSSAQGKFFIVQDMQLTSWDSGSWQIPKLPVIIRRGSGIFNLSAEAIPIEVKYAPEDSTGQLRDIKPVRTVFYIDRTWMYIAAAVLLGLILLFFLIRYLRRRPKKQKEPKHRLSPFDEAMQALASLKNETPDTQEKAKTFYTRLGEIFKQYYSRKRARDFSNQTTAELLRTLNRNNTPEDVVNFISEALQTSDATKFAKYLPPAYETDKCREFVSNAIVRIEKLNKSV